MDVDEIAIDYIIIYTRAILCVTKRTRFNVYFLGVLVFFDVSHAFLWS